MELEFPKVANMISHKKEKSIIKAILSLTKNQYWNTHVNHVWLTVETAIPLSDSCKKQLLNIEKNLIFLN